MANAEHDIMARVDDTQVPSTQPTHNVRKFWTFVTLRLRRVLQQMTLFFDTRDTSERKERLRRALDAESRVPTTPVSKIEERFKVNRYAYPSQNSGYHVHERFHRPKSRSEEYARHEQAVSNNAERVEHAQLATSIKE